MAQYPPPPPQQQSVYYPVYYPAPQNSIRQQIFAIRQKIDAAEAAAQKTTAVCTGNVLEYGSVSATVYIDQATGKLALSCVINKPDISTGGQ